MTTFVFTCALNAANPAAHVNEFAHIPTDLLLCGCSRMQTAEAELLYIKEVEKLDGFGQESFPAKVDERPKATSTCTRTCKVNNTCPHATGQLHQRYFHRGVLHRSVCQTPKRQIHHAPQASPPPLSSSASTTSSVMENLRRVLSCDRWKDIGTIAHNKSAITVEIMSRDDTIVFHLVSVVSASDTRAAPDIGRRRRTVTVSAMPSLFFCLCSYVQEDMEMAKYIARLFTARHKFYKQNKICAE